MHRVTNSVGASGGMTAAIVTMVVAALSIGCRSDGSDPFQPGPGTPLLQKAGIEEPVAVSVDLHANLRKGGEVLVRGWVRCDPVGAATGPLEAFVQLSQDEGFIFGEGFIQSIECDGKKQRWDTRAQAIEGAFHRGAAFASAFVLVCDEEAGICEQGQDSRTIRIRGRR